MPDPFMLNFTEELGLPTGTIMLGDDRRKGLSSPQITVTGPCGVAMLIVYMPEALKYAYSGLTHNLRCQAMLSNAM